MATIRNLQLEVQLNGGPNDPVRVVVDYDIVFNSLDRNENVRYRELARVIGDDTGIPGDILNAGDDLLRVMLDQVTETAGQQAVRRHLERTISRSTANEDPSGFAPKDELRAEVSLRDVQGLLQPVFAESNLVEDRF
ncbi:MAG: hypothetical protein ACRDTG_21035 [Pseudonocardiaceae bacterium]